MNEIERSGLQALYTSLFYWALAALAGIERGFWRPTLTRLSSAAAWREDEAARPAIAFALLTITAVQVYLFMTGQVTLNGVDNSSGDFHLPEAIMAIMNLSDPILAMAAWIIGRWRRPWIMVQIAILTAGWQVVWLGGMGRRNLIYAAVTFVTVFLWARQSRISRRFLMMAVPLVVVLYFFTKLFVAMRYASYVYASEGAQPSLMKLYSDAFTLLTTEADTVAALEKENYSGRFFILGHLTLTIDGLTLPMAQFGKFLFITIFDCIPSFFYPEKVDIMLKYNWFGDGKQLLNDLLGMEQLDFAWTPVVTSYADFMWLGAVLYPPFFLLLGWIFSRFVQSLRYPTFMIACLGLSLMEFVSTEAAMSQYILTGRTLVIFWLFAKCVEFVNRPAAIPA